jgi:hypothetical protein
MNSGGREKAAITFSLLLMALAVLPLLIPETSAVSPDNARQGYVVPTTLDLNVTNVSLANRTFPVRNQVGTPQIYFQIMVSETLLPAPKGEMAIGPRTINISVLLGTLAVLVLIVGALGFGAWYNRKRMPDEDTDGKPDEDTDGKPEGDTEE